MSKQDDQKLNQTESTNKPVQKEKLPYVKPELYLLNLDGTEGKASTVAYEYTTVIYGTIKLGPS